MSLEHFQLFFANRIINFTFANNFIVIVSSTSILAVRGHPGTQATQGINILNLFFTFPRSNSKGTLLFYFFKSSNSFCCIGNGALPGVPRISEQALCFHSSLLQLIENVSILFLLKSFWIILIMTSIKFTSAKGNSFGSLPSVYICAHAKRLLGRLTDYK